MEITLKKFDMDAYIKRRILELGGHKVYSDPLDDETLRYTRQRMHELRQMDESQRDLDKSLRACYTVGTVGDRDGKP